MTRDSIYQVLRSVYQAAGPLALAFLIVSSLLLTPLLAGGMAVQPANAAGAGYVGGLPTVGESSGLFSKIADFLTGNDNSTLDDDNTVDNTTASNKDEVLQEWHTEATALGTSQENIVDTRQNYAYDSRFIAVSEGNIEAYLGLNNNLTKSETKTDAVARSNDYLAGIEENNIRLQEQQALETYTWLQTINSSEYADNYTVTARPAGVGADAYEPSDDGISRSDADIVVAQDGTGDYSSFQTAVSNSNSGDIIYVDSGSYTISSAGGVQLSNVTVVGANDPVINGGNMGFDTTEMLILQDSASLKGFVVDSTGYPDALNDVIEIEQSSATLSYVTVRDATNYNSYNVQDTSASATVTNNLIYEASTTGFDTGLNVVGQQPFDIDPSAASQPTETVTLVNGTQVDVTGLTVDDGSGSRTTQLTKYFDGGTAWKLVAQPPTDSNEPQVVFNAADWATLSEDTQQTQDYVDNNVRALVDTVYNNYEPDEVNASDVLTPTDLERQFSTDFQSTGSLAAVQAQAALYGYNTDLNASVKVDTDGDGNVNNAGTLFTRASAPTDPDNDSQGEWVVGQQYDSANLDAPVYMAVQTTDGVELIKLDGTWTILSAQNPETGTAVDTVENEQFSYADADNADLQQQQERYTVVLETEEDRTAGGGGGGGGDGSGIGTTPLLYLGGVVVAGYVVVRLLRNRD